MFGLLFEHGTRYEYLAVSSAEEPRNRVHVTGRCTPSILPSTPTTIAGGRGVLIIKHGRSRMTIDLAPRQCRDRARHVFTDQPGVGRNDE